MPKNIIIAEGGVGRRFPNISRLMTHRDDGADLWVPTEDRVLTQKYIGKNGMYRSIDDSAYGYSKITANVQGGAQGTLPYKPTSGIAGSIIDVATIDGSAIKAYDPNTNKISIASVLPDGTLSVVPTTEPVPRKAERDQNAQYVTKVKGFRTLVGHRAEESDYHGVTREAVTSSMILSFVIVQQTVSNVNTKTTVGSALSGGDFLYLGEYSDDDPTYNPRYLTSEPSAYRFDNMAYAPSEEIVTTNGYNSIDVSITITLSYPTICNPFYARLGTNANNATGLFDGYPDATFLGSVAGTHYLKYRSGGSNDPYWKLILRDSDYGGTDPCTLMVDPVSSINRRNVLCVYMSLFNLGNTTYRLRNSTYTYTGSAGGFDTIALPDEVEYCGTIEEAPSSAFLLN